MPCRASNGLMVSAVQAVWAHLKSLEAREETILALETTLAAARQSAEAGLDALTRREKEVLGLIARGHSNAEIAEAFVISEGTVKTHVKRVLSKLDLRDRTQAASFAYEIGFVQPGDTASADVPTPIDSRRRTG